MQEFIKEKLEVLQKKHDRLVDKIRQLRGVQKDFFKYRASADLKRSRRLEKEVDDLINEEVKEQKSKQSEIF